MSRALLLALAACSSGTPPTPATPPAAPLAATHGTVVTKHVASASLGVVKSVVVYLPAGYDSSTKHYPVYYFLHGLGGDETTWVKGGHLDEAADKLGVQAIIVMPDGDNSFYTDSVTPMDYDKCLSSGVGMFIPQQDPKSTCVKTANYESWITKDLVVWADATFRTIPAKAGRAIAGMSMGGYGALVLAMRHKDVFAAAVSHSGVDALLYLGPIPYAGLDSVQLAPLIPAEVGDMYAKWLKSLLGPDIANWRAHDPSVLVADLKPGELALYVDCGTDDVFHFDNGMRYLHDLLLANKIEHEFYVGDGGKHDFSFWRPRLPVSLAFLGAHVTPAL